MAFVAVHTARAGLDGRHLHAPSASRTDFRYLFVSKLLGAIGRAPTPGPTNLRAIGYAFVVVAAPSVRGTGMFGADKRHGHGKHGRDGNRNFLHV